MKTCIRNAALAAAAILTTTVHANDLSLKSIYHDAIGGKIAESGELAAALFDGTPTLNLRLGYEYSDLEDNPTDAATALTLRSRFTYKTGAFAGFSGLVQVQNTWDWVDDYNAAGRGGDPGHDVVADVDGTRIHQGYLDFAGIPDTVIRVGVAEVVLDDARLIGNVGWRQAAQSFGGVSVTNTAIDDLTLFAGVYNHVYNIHYEDNPDLDSLILLNAKYKMSEDATVVAFVYLNDLETGTKDSVTYGARLYGTVESVGYDLTLAGQDDYADGSGHEGILAQASATVPVGKIKVGAGYSYISGGAGNEPFDTLYSTAHAFNGWSDQFLGTNGGLAGGIQDFYLQAGTPIGKGKLLVRAHTFHTADDAAGAFSGEYGREIDAVYSYPLAKNLTGLLKVACYRAEDAPLGTPGGNDEQVVWARLEYTF